MNLYHGSYMKVEVPDLALSRKNLDFGVGFYTTENKDQAIAFAEKVKIRKNQTNQTNKTVNVYNFDLETSKPELDILLFISPDINWLDYVHKNRNGTYNKKIYDLVIGPVANDDVFTTLLIYEQGILNTEQTLDALKIKKLFNQYVFKTEKALSFLNYIGSFQPGAIS